MVLSLRTSRLIVLLGQPRISDRCGTITVMPNGQPPSGVSYLLWSLLVGLTGALGYQCGIADRRVPSVTQPGPVRPASADERVPVRAPAALPPPPSDPAGPRDGLGVPEAPTDAPTAGDASARGLEIAPLPSLQAILSGGERRLAVMNDRVVGEGDRLGAFTVVTIAADRVAVRGRSGVVMEIPIHGTRPSP